MPRALTTRPLTPERMDDLGHVLRGSWGRTCWCMFPRLTDREWKALPAVGRDTADDPRRQAMSELAGRDRAPGLLGYLDDRPVAWVAVAPRHELARLVASRATPPVDDEPVFVVPCITVTRPARGSGLAVAMVRAAVSHAGEHGARWVEAYPRLGGGRIGDDNVFYGTEPMFRRAGFDVVRGPLPGLPRSWTQRVTMRCATS